MKTCFSCQQPNVDPEDPPLYDVLRPGYDPANQPVSTVGPYCSECWPATATAQAIAAQAASGETA